MNYFILELDTTSPEINIIAPNYTTRNIKTVITIEGNENLSNYQDIYIIDNLNNRHNLIFNFINGKFVGEIYFSNLPTGISTIYAQCKDEVDNLSNIATKTINIIESEFISVKAYSTKNSCKINNIKNKVISINKKNIVKVNSSEVKNG